MIDLIILASGNGGNAENLVRSLHRKKAQNKNLDDKILNVSCIISNNPSAFVLQRAKNLGIDSICISSKGISSVEFDNNLLTFINSINVDILLLAGFMKILGKNFLNSMSKIKILNIHPSFLPLHKGANGIKDSFYDENDFGGVSVHFVTEELDSGEIILQEKIRKGDNFLDFQNRIHALEYILYPKAVLKIIENSCI